MKTSPVNIKKVSMYMHNKMLIDLNIYCHKIDTVSNSHIYK